MNTDHDRESPWTEGYLLKEQLDPDEETRIGARLRSKQSRHRGNRVLAIAAMAAACVGLALGGLVLLRRPAPNEFVLPIVTNNHPLASKRVFLRIERTDIPGCEPVVIDIEVIK